MKIYRLLHKYTGLFYCPVRRVISPITKRYIKSNLSKTGKMYRVKPSKSWYKGYRDTIGRYIFENTCDDFELIEIDI